MATIESQSHDRASFLGGVRVLELADELGEYCGKVLAGLGADVIKVEPPEGEATRQYGPFHHDTPHPDRSLYFWHYNFGKRGVVVDLDSQNGQDDFRDLARSADIIVTSRPPSYLAKRGVGYEALRTANPGLVFAHITPFGDSGPWAEYQASDLVHLALGGVVMNCGYDPDPTGHYDTPPVAPQMWHAYHIAGEHAAMGILAALSHRLETGAGQKLSVAVHKAVSTNTENDVPNWVYQRRAHFRQTCRSSMPEVELPALARTKDGRWLLPYRTYLPPVFGDPFHGILELLRSYDAEMDLGDEQYQDAAARTSAMNMHIGAVTDRLIEGFKYDRDLWLEAQKHGLTWAPCRRPEENLGEDHWAQRETFIDVRHPELDETVKYVGAKWFAPDVPWRRGPRAPTLGEHTDEVLSAARAEPTPPAGSTSVKAPNGRVVSKHGKPFALSGVRVVDLSWLLASGGAGRYLASLGAEVIKVEHKSRIDAMRFGIAFAPPGGRGERDRASEPIKVAPSDNMNRSGVFMEINAGKRAVSLNLKESRGKELLTELLKEADMVVEGFSPGTMKRLGFGYDRLREINPRLIYVQQSGMGETGTYGQLRSYGPTAQAITGISEMSGLPDPYPPAGIGYSYLDWFGAYNMALAMLAALYRQRVTGEGCWIDSSQAEAGIYLTGTAVLDYGVNNRPWRRYGNRSPYKLGAPHGVYRVAGEDRWVAVSCFTDEQWRGFASVLGGNDWLADARFATLEDRARNQDALELLISGRTAEWERYELMAALQAAGVAAGVCQTAQDRCDVDPQLAHLGWTVELEQSEIGKWPVKEFPVDFSETPPYIGGPLDRHGPSYGEDNDYVLGRLLGLPESAIESLRADGVI
jgi:crotonobetainyl-CoA:carnitine CoA-transferase CaiB-like acyl-CoA transferase